LGRIVGFLLLILIVGAIFGPPIVAFMKLTGTAIALSYVLIFSPWLAFLGYFLLWTAVFNASLHANRIAIAELIGMAAQSSIQANAIAAKIVGQQSLKQAAAALHVNQKAN